MNLQEQTNRIRQMMGLLSEQEQKKYSTIIIFGPQGVGKSTLTKPLGEKLGMQVISSDDFVGQGDWSSEKTLKQGWNKRKENEFEGMKKFLKDYLGKSVILDIGGSHGVWEGNHLEKIKSMISHYPNTFLLLPSEDMGKSKEYLRKNILKRESGIEGAIEYWKKLLSKDENYVNTLNDEDKEDYLERLEKIKNGDTKEAQKQIDRMQKRLDIINSDNVNWKEFDIDDEDSENVKFMPDEFHDFSKYFINNMKESGVAKHTIYNLGKKTDEVINDIIKVLK